MSITMNFCVGQNVPYIEVDDDFMEYVEMDDDIMEYVEVDDDDFMEYVE